MNRMNEIIKRYGEEYMLRQFAEECTELAQAALKLIRAKRKETPMREDEARERFVEEIADVNLMAGIVFNYMLSKDEQNCVDAICEQKEYRMYKRLRDGDMEDDA